MPLSHSCQLHVPTSWFLQMHSNGRFVCVHDRKYLVWRACLRDAGLWNIDKIAHTDLNERCHKKLVEMTSITNLTPPALSKLLKWGFGRGVGGQASNGGCANICNSVSTSMSEKLQFTLAFQTVPFIARGPRASLAKGVTTSGFDVSNEMSEILPGRRWLRHCLAFSVFDVCLLQTDSAVSSSAWWPCVYRFLFQFHPDQHFEESR